jgi:hypothetical protein
MIPNLTSGNPDTAFSEASDTADQQQRVFCRVEETPPIRLPAQAQNISINRSCFCPSLLTTVAQDKAGMMSVIVNTGTSRTTCVMLTFKLPSETLSSSSKDYFVELDFEQLSWLIYPILAQFGHRR